MFESLTIDEVVCQTGLTSRALRFYEARGLLQPLRTASGRRIFATADIERVHHILAMKKAGLSLTQMKRVFDSRPVDLASLLHAQKEVLTFQARQVAEALTLIEIALSRIDRGEPLDAATLCSLIRNGDRTMPQETDAWKGVIDRYYTSEDQAEWQAKWADAQPFDQAEYHQKWRRLSQRIEDALPLDPASETARAFVKEWFQLLEPFSRVATPNMWEKSAAMFADMKDWSGQADPGFSKPVWDFICQVAAIARAAGKDIGPLPEFLKM